MKFIHSITFLSFALCISGLLAFAFKVSFAFKVFGVVLVVAIIIACTKLALTLFDAALIYGTRPKRRVHYIQW